MTSTDISDVDSIQSYHSCAPVEVKLTIHHQFPGVELVSPVYAGNGTTCYLSPDQRVDVGSTTQAGFKLDFPYECSTDILMYKLQRKNIDQSDDEEAISTQFFMIWEVDSFRNFCTVSYLIEHDEGKVWDEDKLMDLAERYSIHQIQYGHIEETWLMRDNTVLMTCLNVTYEEECYKLEMTISEASMRDDTRRPRYIDVDR
jgi:hypothetical protein